MKIVPLAVLLPEVGINQQRQLGSMKDLNITAAQKLQVKKSVYSTEAAEIVPTDKNCWGDNFLNHVL